MADNNSRPVDKNRQNPISDALDRELDTALAKLAAVEPRAGLEQRVLANLRAEQYHTSTLSWSRWPAIAALLTILVLILSLTWRSGKPGRIAAQHTVAPMQNNDHPGTQAANNAPSRPIRSRDARSARWLKPHAVIHPATTIASAPKLDQFPSPQPLSEQEKILAHYVTNYPQHAAMIAQARSDELRRDSVEESDDAARENSKQRDK
jgi:hypothetical protein